MHCYAFVMLYLKDGPLRSLKEFQLFLCLLNVCFKIFCRKYQMPRGRRRGEQRVGEEEEDEEGGNFKFSFVFFM